MARYNLTLKDGSAFEVEAPAGASQAEILRRANQQMSVRGMNERRDARTAERQTQLAELDAMRPPPREPETGFLGDLVGGFGAGVVNIGETAALGAATLLDEEQELAARERIQNAASAIRPSMGDEEDLTYKIGSTFGSIAGFIGAGAAVTYGAGALGLGVAGAGIAGLVGAGTLGVGAATGEASERARAAGATQEERNRAIMQAIPVGASEVLPLRRILGKLTGDLGEELVQTFRQRVVSALRTGGEEAAQEAAAGIAQNLIERGYNIDQAVLEGAGEAAALGGGAAATIQVLVDLFAGRRARGATPPPEGPEQGELFPGADLGQAPTRVMGDQREMFPEEDLGMAPERPDERQGELFSAQDQQSAAFARTARRADEERARLMERPISEFESEGDPFLERTKAERDAARAGIAGLQRPEQPEPEQRDMIRELEAATIPEEEQRAQAAAREREGLRAAGRGDEAAFEQPDLFALQQEQERRRLGPEELRRPDQFMDVPEAAETVTPEQPAAMGDLVDMADQRQRTAAEDADIADQLAAIDAEEGAQQQQAAALRAESDIETITGQQETQRQQATEQGRRSILQDVIEKTPSRNYNRVSRMYEDALTKAGYQGDKAKPTEAEIQTIQRAVNVQRAERPEPVSPVAEPIKLPPEATQLQEMESRIPERAAQREPEQLGMPGIRRRIQEAPAREGMAPEAQAAPETVTDEMLDQMGIAPRSPIRQRLRGKDLNDPTTREILTSFANQPRTSQTAELGISRRLEGVPEEQPDLFAPSGRRSAAAQPAPQQTPAGPAAQPAPSAQQNAPQQLELFPETAQGVTDGTAAPNQQRDRASVRGGGRGVAGPGGVGGTGGGARTPTAPEPRGLGASIASAVPAAAPKAAERSTLGEGGTRRNVMPTLPRRPIIDPKTLKPIGEERVGPTSRALAPREKISAKSEPKVSGDQVTKQLKDWYEANVSAPAKQFVKNLGMSITSPLTIADKAAILAQLNTKSTKENKTTIGALKKYLGAYPDPALGLQDAIDDVVAQTPNFRRTEDMTDGESEFFGATKDGKTPARGKNAAQYVLDWASKNMSEATKRWTAGKIVESKNAMQAIEAFESTDLVATRRELEKAFEGGFDPTKDADNKRLADVLEKLGLDESDPMVRGMLYKGGMFNMAVPTSRHPLSQVTVALLRKGDLAGALRSVAASSADPEVAAVAEKLAKVVGDTKVEVVKSIAPGVLGRYAVKDNTILLAEFAGFRNNVAVNGLNTHVLLHEMTHAATVFTLLNKGHPLTRKLKKIFEETKEFMPTAYGSISLEEFVAEAFSNPEFQSMLAGLKIKGDPLTPFAKIKAAISNFLRSLVGKPVKPVQSALEQTTSIIDNILAPAPGNIGTGEFFMLSPVAAGKRIAEMLGDIQKQSKPVTKEFAQKFADNTREFLRGTATDKAKRGMLGFLPSQAVADVAERSGIKGAMDLHKLMEEQRGAINKSDQAVEGVLKSVANWVKSHQNQVDALNRVVYKSTIEQVDPSKPISAYANDPEKAKAWRDMRNDWRALSSTGGDKVYAQMRDTYKKQYEKMRDVIYGKIDETITDEAARKKLKNEVYARLFESGTIEPYFPLTRAGNYWLSYVAEGEFTVEAFETMAERDRAITDLKADTSVKDVEKFVNINNASYAKAPPSSFVGQTLQTLRANRVPDDVQAEIMRLFIETLPETSFAKSLQRRKGTAGYQEDAIFALKTKAFDLGRQVERLRYSAKLRTLQDSINEDNRPNLTEENKYIVDELNLRADFARNPPRDGLAQAANRAAFVFTIGFNASSAVVNLSQLPMFVYPMFAGKYGYGAAGRAIMDASKLVTSSGFNRKSDMVAPYGNEKNIKVRAMPSIDNYFELDANGDYVVRKDLDLEPEVIAKVEELKPLVAMMAARGQLNRSLFADNLGIDSSGRERGIIDMATAASAFMFHNVEVFNRQVTAISAYQLELARLKKAEPTLSTTEMQTKAAEQALEDTQRTNGGSVLETAPRLGQQGIGRVALMYKTYGIQMYYSMFKTVRDGMEAHFAGDKDARNEALRQFAGVTGASFLLAGVVGMPLARELLQLMNLLFFDEEEDTAETQLRKAIGEGFYKGPATALLGVDLSSRIGLSGLILQANRFNHDASLEEDVFHYLGGPAWSTISGFNRGRQDIMNGEIERGVEAMIPAGIRNMYQAAFRFPNDEGILTRRGDPIMDDLSFGQLAAKFVGFAPADYTRTQEMNQQTKNVDRSVNSARTTILRRYYVATRMGDSDERRAMMQRIKDFNRRHPTARIDADSLRRSMRQHMETSATMYNGISISPNMRRALDESRDEWNQGFQLFD